MEWSRITKPYKVLLSIYNYASNIRKLEASDTPEYIEAYESMRTNIDSLVLRIPYYAYADNLGMTMNDGQVAVAHSMFRHDYLSLGTGKSYKIVDLGVVGATHWEVTLNPVFNTPEKWKKDTKDKPYFHASVLNAIAKTIVSDKTKRANINIEKFQNP